MIPIGKVPRLASRGSSISAAAACPAAAAAASAAAASMASIGGGAGARSVHERVFPFTSSSRTPAWPRIFCADERKCRVYLPSERARASESCAPKNCAPKNCAEELRAGAHSEVWKPRRSAPNTPCSNSLRIGSMRKTSEVGKGVCRNQPMLSSGIRCLSIDGSSIRW